MKLWTTVKRSVFDYLASRGKLELVGDLDVSGNVTVGGTMSGTLTVSDGAITTAKIAAGAIAATANGRAKIADGTFTAAEFASGAGGKFAADCIDATTLPVFVKDAAFTEANVNLLFVSQAIDGGTILKDGTVNSTKLTPGVMAYRAVITDPGNANYISVVNAGTCRLVSAGPETRKLAIPTYMGQTINLAMETDGGLITLTSDQAFNQAGNTTITFGDVGDLVSLVAIYVSGALRWRVLGSNFGSGGGALSA